MEKILHGLIGSLSHYYPMVLKGWLAGLFPTTVSLINQVPLLPLGSTHTPWKMNMSTENQWLEDVFPIEIVPF